MSDEKKPKLSDAERYEKRRTLLQLLLIFLVIVAIAYLGFHLATGVVIFVLWLLGIALGAGS